MTNGTNQLARVVGVGDTRLDLIRKAQSLKAQLRWRLEQERALLVDQLNKDAAELENQINQLAPPAYGSWSHPGWRDFAGTADAVELPQVLVGYAAEPALLEGEVGLRSAPKFLPLLDLQGPLIFKHTAQSKPLARTLMQSVILRCALAMPQAVTFRFLNPLASDAFPMKKHLETDAPDQDLYESLNAIRADISRVVDHIVRGKDSLAKMHAAERGTEGFVVVAAADFPKGYSEDSKVLEYLSILARSGPKTGRYLLLEFDQTQPAPPLSEDIFANATVVDCDTLDFVPDPLPNTATQDLLIASVMPR